MKTERNMMIAFMLNLSFALFELVGGMWIGSIAILSDAIHDVGDAVSIGLAWALERRSRKPPNDTYTYGYARYSLIGGWITATVLIGGSLVMIGHAVDRMVNPTEIHYNGMILLAVIGVCVNGCAAFFTHTGDSLNRKAVHLHMLEDVLGWAAVLVGAVAMRFTDLAIFDPILSVGVALFILIQAVRNAKGIVEVLLEKVPAHIKTADIREDIQAMDGVLDVHHIHVWSLDGQRHAATVHAVIDGEPHTIKKAIREAVRKRGVGHVTVETETAQEPCREKRCCTEAYVRSEHGHRHHAAGHDHTRKKP